MYNTYISSEFSKKFRKADSVLQLLIKKTIKQISIYPRGKPLHTNWLYERKLKGKRLIYAVNWKTRKVLILVFVDKKSQKQTILYFVKNKEEIMSVIS
jgi:mRNA-degrading endonuclease RelE of RelBE toxin-antitoxin system